MARVLGQKSMNTVVSSQEKVRRFVKNVADHVGRRAESRLATARANRKARFKGLADNDPPVRIEVSQGDVDAYVTLVHPAARAIEFGHVNHLTGRWVEGLRIITGAID